MNAQQLNTLTNKQLAEKITELGLPKMKGHPKKEQMIDYIVAKQEAEEMEVNDYDAPAPAPASRHNGIGTFKKIKAQLLIEEDMCDKCGANAPINGETLCAECWEPPADDEEVSLPELEDEEAECEDCGHQFNNEGNPALRFCENCDDHRSHTTDDELEEIFGEDCEECDNHCEPDGRCFDCEIAPKIGGEGNLTEVSYAEMKAIVAEDGEAEAHRFTTNDPLNDGFNGDRCPVCLDEDCSTYTTTCEHMLCGGCYDQLPNKVCPMCRIPIRGVKEGQTTDEQKIAEWREMKQRLAQFEAGIRPRAVRQARAPRAPRAPRAVAVGGGGAPRQRRQAQPADGEVPDANGFTNRAPASSHNQPALAEGQVLGDLPFNSRARLCCSGEGCDKRTRRVCEECREHRLCSDCGSLCPACSN